MADIKIVTSNAEIKTCLMLRRTVFIEEQNVPEHEEVDGADGHCSHILALVNGKPLGAARFQYIDRKAKIQRVCVLQEARGIGLGGEIIREILKILRVEGKTNTAVLGAQIHALKFYEKLGFSAFGDEYLGAGIAHQDMKISL